MRSRSTPDVRGQLGDRALEALQLGLQLAPLAQRPGEPFGRSGEPGVVLIEPTGELVLAASRARRARHAPTATASSAAASAATAASARSVASVKAAAVAPPPAAPDAASRSGANRSPSAVTITAVGWSSAASTAVSASATRTDPPTSESSNAATPSRVERTCGRTGSPTAGGARRVDPVADGQHGTAHVGVAQRGERSPGSGTAVDDDGGERLAQRRFDRRLPAAVDLDDVEQRAEHAVDPGEPLGPGPGIGPHRAPTGAPRPGPPLATTPRTHRGDAGCTARIGPRPRPATARPARSRRRAATPPTPAAEHSRAETFRLRGQLFDPHAELVGAGGGAPQLALAALDPGADRAELAAHLGRSARRLRPACVGGLGDLVEPRPLGAERLFVLGECLTVGSDLFEGDDDLGELGAEAGRIGFEVGHHTGVEQLAVIAFERSLALGEHAGEAAGALAQLLHEHQPVADVVLATRRQLGLERHDLGVEPGERGLQLTVGARRFDAVDLDRLELGPQRRDLAPGDEHPQLVELLDQHLVPARRLGLALERLELTAHLAEQVLEAQQVRLGRVEAALGLLLALAVLQDAGGLFDDRATVLGAGVQHGVDLALADDHVLLATDAGVGQQLLQIEQAARRTVDRVLALTAAEQDAGEGDLVELERQQTRGVVEREADLGPPERRALLGAGEDDVVHLLRADRLRRLGAEHPRDRVDDVRLARAVGADDDGDPRFEDHRGRVGERLEALEGETLQEHGDRDASGCALRPPTHPPSPARLPRTLPARTHRSAPRVGACGQRWQRGQ